MAGQNQYSETVRMAMRTVNNPTGAELSIREVSKLTGYSFEHVRRVVAGEPCGSREFNDSLCRVLGLDAEEMWELTKREKIQRKFGTAVLAQLPKDDRLAQLWPKLTESDRERILKIAEGMALANEALSDHPLSHEPKRHRRGPGLGNDVER